MNIQHGVTAKRAEVKRDHGGRDCEEDHQEAGDLKEKVGCMEREALIPQSLQKQRKG